MAVFEDLNGLNINGHTEEKVVSGTRLTYLSWPWAWAEVKKRYPDAHYEIWKNEHNLPFAYDPQTGYMVYTSVTIEGVTHEMWLPVMDGANKAMKAAPYKYLTKYGEKSVEAASMMDINKTIMRCLVKNLAMFGLGLYIYAGEDLPEGEKEEQKASGKPQNKQENGTVTKADKLPAGKQEGAKQAENKPETVAGFLSRSLVEMGKKYKDFNFKNARDQLINGGVIPDIPSATMTMDQAKQLINAVKTVYEEAS